MDSIVETPVKHGAGSVARHVIDIDALSSDELHTDLDGVDILPAPHHFASQLQSSYVTQPTQILNTPDRRPHSPTASKSTVQVAASSPSHPHSPVPQKQSALNRPPVQRLQSIRPPGTIYREPAPPQRAAPRAGAPNATPPAKSTISISSDEEGVKYSGPTSDEDNTQQARRDIKPSFPKISRPYGQANGVSGRDPKKSDPIQEIMAKYANKPKTSGFSFIDLVDEVQGKKPELSPVQSRPPAQATKPLVQKRPAGDMADAYGNTSRLIKKRRTFDPIAQLRPLAMSDMHDPKLREKLEQMRSILPDARLEVCKYILERSHGDVDQAVTKAMEYTEARDNSQFLSDGDEDALPTPSPMRATTNLAKQQLKAPAKTIQEKYMSKSQVQRPLASKQSTRSSPVAPKTPVEQPKKRKLMRGRRDPSPEPRKARKISRETTPFSVSSDSGVATADESDHATFGGSLLDFFNTCSVADLCDLASIEEKEANIILAKKPFRTLAQIQKITDPADVPAQAPKMKRKTTKRTLGEKIVDVSEKMWAGYEAVERLVEQCNEYSKSVADEMKKWGVDVFGASKAGEVELVSLTEPTKDKSDSSLRDSGIGSTPAESESSHEESHDVKVKAITGKRKQQVSSFISQPAIMSNNITLKDYQVVGLNWLAMLYRQKLSGILADDMGLGKTCQVIAFLSHLHEQDAPGPHLVIVPASTLENWLREFQTFCPALNVVPYYGSQKVRAEMQYQILEAVPDVLVTTYETAKPKDDRIFLRKLQPNVVVYDEGHQLKNSKSKGYADLMRIKCNFRLLLTGTPLQNNLSELCALLGFILPAVFDEHREDLEAIFGHRAKTTDDKHTALLSAQRIERARCMLAPFVLRRKKHQVLKHLPTKTRRVVYCDMTEAQKDMYDAEIARRKKILAERAEGIQPNKADKEAANNVLMALRQTAIHPLLRRKRYEDALLPVMAEKYVARFPQKQLDYVMWDLEHQSDWTTHRFCLEDPTLRSFALPGEPCLESGKVAALVDLLRTYKAASDRVLIFSQFTQVMDILEEVLELEGVKFFRLDGGTRVEQRQELIDGFYADASVTAFLLSTRAGGAGINLACANKVVVFDSSFNPQDDIQAENRAHRVGQTRPVEVVRLVTRGTVEEQIHALGASKIALDERVAGEGAAGDEKAAAEKAEKEGMAAVEAMLEQGEGGARGGKGEIGAVG